MSFLVYDLVFLVGFLIFVSLFLYKRRKTVKREMGIAFLYPSKFGIKTIDMFAEKFEKILKPLRIVVVGVGYFLMVYIVWFLIEATYIYLTTPISEMVRAPPIAPLIPYFPKLFGLESYFPPLYFTYFIVAVAIGGVLHEFSHGIFARIHNLKIKSTGFLFLGPLLGAFVEPDEEQMKKTKRFPHLSILGAGVFANVLAALIFGGILVLFFGAVFSPVGVGFNTYTPAVINLSESTIPSNFSLDERYIVIEFDGDSFLVGPTALQNALEKGDEIVYVYKDAPAARAELPGTPSAIMEIGDMKTTTIEELSEAISAHKPGDVVNVKVAKRDGFFDTSAEIENYEIEFEEKDGKAVLGIGVIPASAMSGKVSTQSSFGFIFRGFGTMDQFTFYESAWGDFGWFIYFLIWWIVLINALLAIFNMLPLGPFDGGKFFELTIGGITGSKTAGQKAFRFATWFFLLLLGSLMVKWFVGFF